MGGDEGRWGGGKVKKKNGVRGETTQFLVFVKILLCVCAIVYWLNSGEVKLANGNVHRYAHLLICMCGAITKPGQKKLVTTNTRHDNPRHD